MGDLAVWDNLCVMHRGWPYDYRETRIMMHTRIAGNPETEYAPTVSDPLADTYEPLDFEVWCERAGVWWRPRVASQCRVVWCERAGV